MRRAWVGIGLGLSAFCPAENLQKVVAELVAAKARVESLTMGASVALERGLGKSKTLEGLAWRTTVSHEAGARWACSGEKRYYRLPSVVGVEAGGQSSMRRRVTTVGDEDWEAAVPNGDGRAIDPICCGYRLDGFFGGKTTWLADLAKSDPPELREIDGRLGLVWALPRFKATVLVDPRRGYMIERVIEGGREERRVLAAQAFGGAWIPTTFALAGASTQDGGPGPLRVKLGRLDGGVLPNQFRGVYRVGDVKREGGKTLRMADDGSWLTAQALEERTRRKESATEAGLMREYLLWVLGGIGVLAMASVLLSWAKARGKPLR